MRETKHRSQSPSLQVIRRDPATLPREGPPKVPASKRRGRSETDGGEGVIASEAKQSLSANPSEANGGEGNKAPQSITPLQPACIAFRGWELRRTLPLGEGPPKVPASKRRVDVAKRDGGEGVIASEAKQSLSANPSEANGGEGNKAPQSITHSIHSTHTHSRLGSPADPPWGGPPKVPASKRRVDVAKRTG